MGSVLGVAKSNTTQKHFIVSFTPTSQTTEAVFEGQVS